MPDAQTSNSTTNSSSPRYCPVCDGYGIKRTCFKHPEAFPLAEIDWCACNAGIFQRDYWQKKRGPLEQAKRQARIDKLFAGAGIPSFFKDFTVGTLRNRVGNDPGKLAVIAQVEQFIVERRIVDPRTKLSKFGLILSGSFGTGKTGMLTPALRSWLDDGKSALWIEAKEFVKEIQRSYGRGDEDSSEQKLDEAKRADIVLIDDLGDKERIDSKGNLAPEPPDRIEIIYRLINDRHNADRPMLITTNLTGSELSIQLGARTFNRIVESCAWLKMPGKNLRME